MMHNRALHVFYRGVVLAIFAVQALSAQAEVLSPTAHLRKISLQTRGTLPSNQEFAEVQAIAAQGDQALQKYYSRKAAEYLRSDVGFEKMVDRAFEVMRFDLSLMAPESNSPSIYSACDSKQISRLIYRYLLQKTESWDKILLSVEPAMAMELSLAFDGIFCKKYAAGNGSSIMKNHPEIVEELRRNKPRTREDFNRVIQKFIDVSQDSATQMEIKAKLSGKIPSLMSSDIFTQRYDQTMFSQAAALARTYFCNDMRPILLNKGTARAGLANKGLIFSQNGASGQTATLTRKQDDPMSLAHPIMTAAEAMKAEHVKPECAACHRILGPAKALLEGAQNVDMVFDDFEGVEHHVSIPTTADLIPIISKQPQYVNCQVQRMLDWFVGSDVTLQPEQVKSLIADYESSGRNYIKFVSKLVNLPEYYTDDAFSRPTTISSAQLLFNVCNACHDKNGAEIAVFKAPPFAYLGFDEEGMHKDHIDALTRMTKALALPADGSRAIMPPEKAGWKLSDTQRLTVERFIYDQTRTKDGKPTISLEERNLLFKDYKPAQIARIQDRTPKPTFGNTWRAYMRNFDHLRVIWQLFPQAKQSEICGGRELSKTDAATLGAFDAFVGLPAYREPTKQFEEWITNCLTDAFDRDFSESAPDGLAKYHLEELVSAQNSVSSPASNIRSTHWSTIPLARKQVWMNKMIESFVGPGVMPQNQRTTLVNSALATIDQYLPTTSDPDSASTAVFWGVFYIMTDDNFRTF